jgi:murein DD-endopeptidase MepM/ murein hydrolase activator NlpD
LAVVTVATARPSMTPALAERPSAAATSAGSLPRARRRPRPSRLARRSAALVLGTLLLPAPTGAAADTPPGRAVPASPPTVVPPATPPSAAAATVGRPIASAITCRTACLGLSTAKPGATVRVTGDGAGAATSLVFLGRRGRRDDVVAAAQPVGPTAVEATLPARVRSGPVRLITADGRRSTRSARPLRVGAPSRPAPVAVRVAGRRVFVDATRRATLDVFVGGTAPADVGVDLVRDTDGSVVARWTLPAVPGGTVQSVEWDGTSAGAPQPEGRYVFRTSVTSSALRTTATPAGAASTTAPAQAASFVLVRSLFPVVGQHGYGEGAARFGAGRNGHVHQGQDVFAPCGTPVVAAHAGVVKVAGFEARAGNHVIVAAEGGVDQVYMHLRDAALVAEGAPVATGQPIGFVGDTGDAQGCHLHFEIWPAPGWAAGGSPVDPLPSLEAWDTA